jgi:acetyl esterase/lipase
MKKSQKSSFFFAARTAGFFVVLVLASCSTTGKIRDLENCYNYTDVSYGSENSQKLDISVPREADAQINAILYIHGMGADKANYPLLLNDYSGRFIIASMNYRRIGKIVHINDLVSDVESAINEIKRTAQGQGKILNKIILMGNSLGGYLSLVYSYKSLNNPPPVPIAFCVSSSAPTDFADVNHIAFAKRQGGALGLNFLALMASVLSGSPMTREDITDEGFSEPVQEIQKTDSPRFLVKKGTPPTIIIHDTNDPAVPYSNATGLKGALDAMEIPNVFIASYLDLGHGLGNKERKTSRRYDKRIEARIVKAMDSFIALYCN